MERKTGNRDFSLNPSSVARIRSKSPEYASLATGHKINLKIYSSLYSFPQQGNAIFVNCLAWHVIYQSKKENQVLPITKCFEFGLVEKIVRLVVLTMVKFVLERVENETLGVPLRIPRKTIIAKAREVLNYRNVAK